MLGGSATVSRCRRCGHQKRHPAVVVFLRDRERALTIRLWLLHGDAFDDLADGEVLRIPGHEAFRLPADRRRQVDSVGSAQSVLTGKRSGVSSGRQVHLDPAEKAALKEGPDLGIDVLGVCRPDLPVP